MFSAGPPRKHFHKAPPRPIPTHPSPTVRASEAHFSQPPQNPPKSIVFSHFLLISWGQFFLHMKFFGAAALPDCAPPRSTSQPPPAPAQLLSSLRLCLYPFIVVPSPAPLPSLSFCFASFLKSFLGVHQTRILTSRQNRRPHIIVIIIL